LAFGRLVLFGFVLFDFALVAFEVVVFLGAALANFFEEAAAGFLATIATLLRSVIER
jgi:hypothetical protein